jgi:L-lactate utilization protein LutC
MTGDVATLFLERLAEAGGTGRMTGSRAEAHGLVRDLVAGRTVLADRHPTLAGLDIGSAADPWDAEVGVTGVLGAAAESGTLALGAGPDTPRRTSILPSVHVALVPLSLLVPTYADLIELIGRLDPLPSGLQFVTGPSRSGDIEMAMIQGMHGPREVHVLLFPDR